MKSPICSLATAGALALGGLFACAHNTTGGPGGEPPANAREAGNPNSVDNKDQPPPMAPSNPAAVEAREVGNPNSVANKDVSGTQPVDKEMHDQDLRAAEAGDPDSIDSTLPPAPAVLQRLFIFDEASIAAGRMAVQSGGPGGQAYGKRLVRERMDNEQQLSTLAGQQHASLLDKDLTADEKNRRFSKQMSQGNEQMVGLSGVPFDRVFSRHMERMQERQLREVSRLRGRCIEPSVCALLDQMKPMLERARDDARSLNQAVAQNGM